MPKSKKSDYRNRNNKEEQHVNVNKIYSDEVQNQYEQTFGNCKEKDKQVEANKFRVGRN